MESVELKTIVPILQNLSVGELETLSKHICKVREQRMEQRRRELWDNVMAAMQEYCRETGDEIVTDDDHPVAIGNGYGDTCGVLYIGY